MKYAFIVVAGLMMLLLGAGCFSTDPDSGGSSSPQGSLLKNNAPFTPGIPRPTDAGVTDGVTGIVLEWKSIDPDGDEVYYDLAFGTTSPPAVAYSGLRNQLYDLTRLQWGTTYFWQVTATDCVHTVPGPVWSFSTPPEPARMAGWTAVVEKVRRPADVVVTSVAVDAAGQLWMGKSTSGIVRVSPDLLTFTYFTAADSGVPGDDIERLVIGPAGGVWAGIWTQGVAKLAADGSKFEKASFGTGTAKTVLSMEFVDAENSWAGSVNNGIIRVAGDVTITYKDTSKINYKGRKLVYRRPLVPNNMINAIAIDRQGITTTAVGNVWIGTPDGVGVLSKIDTMKVEIRDSVVEYIDSVKYDSLGQRSIVRDTVYIIQDSLQSYRRRHTGDSAGLRTVLYDTSKTPEGARVKFLTDTTWRGVDTICTDDAVEKLSNLVMIVNGEDTIKLYDSVVVHRDTHVVHLDPELDTNWTIYRKAAGGFPCKAATALVIDAASVKWIGTHNCGLVQYDGTTWKQYTTDNSGIPNNHVTALVRDATGKIWVGTREGGLASFDGSTWVVYTKDDSGLASNSVTDLFVDTSNRVWVATDRGVSRFSN